MDVSIERDDNNQIYPSLEGLIHQTVDALKASGDFIWYSFLSPTFTKDGVVLDAVSYDEAGDEDRIYTLTIKVEEQK